MNSINRKQAEENRADLQRSEAVQEIKQLVGKAQTCWQESYYWDTKHGRAVAAIEMLTGAAIGKALDDSTEGTLHL